MSHTAWLRRFAAARRPSRSPRSARPRLEALEARDVPTSAIFFTGANNIASFSGVGFQNNLVTGLYGTYANGQLDPNIGDFSVQVNWGDGSGWQAATLANDGAGGNDTFLVKGSHIYNQIGTFNIEVEGTGPDGASKGPTLVDSATVSYMPAGFAGTPPPPVVSPLPPTNVTLSMTGANNISSFTGVGFQENVVTGLNATLNGQDDTQASDVHAFINWGDGTGWFAADVASNNGGGPTFLVKGGHVYTQAGQYDIVVYALGADGTSLSKQIDSATVANMPSGLPGTPPPAVSNPLAPTNVTLSMTGANNISSFTGVGFQENLVTGLNGMLNGQTDPRAADFRAFINWGDGSGWTAADVAANGGGAAGSFLVKGGHVYGQAGDYAIVVYAVGPDGTTLSEQIDSATVADMPSGLPGTPPPAVNDPLTPANVSLSMTGANTVSALAGVGFQNVVVTGLNGMLNGQADNHATDFHAFINWGDGSGWTAATVVLDGTGGGNPSFLVEGSHTYSAPGQYAIVVYAVGPDGTTFSEQINSAVVKVSPYSSSPVVANFPGVGVWRSLAGAGWTQLTPANASLVATDSAGDVTAEFPGLGVWRYTDAAGWTQLTAADASLLAMDNKGEVFADLGGRGLWRFTGADWGQLSPANASLLAVDAAGDVAADFPGQGVWRFTAGGSWRQLSAADASLLAIDGNADVFADLAGQGVWRYTNAAGWQQLTPANASLLAVDAAGDAAATFAGEGVWRYTSGAAWQQLASATPDVLATDLAGDVYADFAGAGLYECQLGAGWGRKAPSDASAIAAE